MPKKGEKLSQEQANRMKEGRVNAKANREAVANLDNKTSHEVVSTPTTSAEGLEPSVEVESSVTHETSIPAPQASPLVINKTQETDLGKPTSRAELKELNDEIEQYDKILNNRGEDGSIDSTWVKNDFHSVDINKIRHQKRLAENKRDSLLPKAASGIQQDKIRKEITELESSIVDGMPNMNEYYGTPSKNRDQVGLVGQAHKQLRWAEANTSKIVRWKKLLYKLDPDKAINEPDWTNIERVRPGRSGTYDTLARKNDRIMSTGWDRPNMSFKEEQVKMTRNLCPEEVAEDLGISVEEVLALRRGKKDLVKTS